MKSVLDHILWGAPSLNEGMATFEAMTGVAPAIGGSHPGFGTRNALASLNNGIYFEIIVPDPAQSLVDNFGAYLAALSTPRLVGMAMRTETIGDAAAAYEANGVSINHTDMSRKTPDGKTLEWSICQPDTGDKPIDPLRPFFIDWKNTTHPSGTTPTGCTYLDFSIEAPADDAQNALWSALGMPFSIAPADALSASLRVETQKGVVTFTT